MVIVNMEIAEQLLCWYEERDVDAEAYYREFRLNDGNGLSPARIHDLTLKASILNTIERLLVSGVLFQGLRYKVDLQDSCSPDRLFTQSRKNRNTSAGKR